MAHCWQCLSKIEKRLTHWRNELLRVVQSSTTNYIGTNDDSLSMNSTGFGGHSWTTALAWRARIGFIWTWQEKSMASANAWKQKTSKRLPTQSKKLKV